MDTFMHWHFHTENGSKICTDLWGSLGQFNKSMIRAFHLFCASSEGPFIYQRVLVSWTEQIFPLWVEIESMENLIQILSWPIFTCNLSNLSNYFNIILYSRKPICDLPSLTPGPPSKTTKVILSTKDRAKLFFVYFGFSLER